jgi:predicted secreted Zn-dependent protease
MGNEYGMGKKFLHALRPNEVSHCELLLTMLNRITSETSERYERVNVRFEKAVYYFLRLVKPISFS